jgi:high-affinity Fe2+/Pb2+ permease
MLIELGVYAILSFVLLRIFLKKPQLWAGYAASSLVFFSTTLWFVTFFSKAPVELFHIGNAFWPIHDLINLLTYAVISLIAAIVSYLFPERSTKIIWRRGVVLGAVCSFFYTLLTSSLGFFIL